MIKNGSHKIIIFPSRSIEIITILKTKVPLTINEIKKHLKIDIDELRDVLHILYKYGVVKKTSNSSIQTKYFLFSHGPVLKTVVSLIKENTIKNNRRMIMKFNFLLLLIWVLNFLLIFIFIFSLLLIL